MLFASPAYGMHLTTWWQPDVIWRDMDLVKEMGFGWVKQPVAWSDIEKGQDGFDWYFLDEVIVPGAESRGLKLLLRLDRSPLWAVEEKPGLSANTPPQDFADYGDFCGQMAARYRGRVQAYQVWNEPNLHREWGNAKPDPVAYTQLLKVCYEAIKSADPAAIVISAALAPTCDNSDQATDDMTYLRGMYAAGAAAYFDVLGVNAPGFDKAPEAGFSGVYSAENCPAYAYRFRHVEDMRQIMLDNGDAAKQIAILEMGWITNDAAGYTKQTLDQLHPAYSWFAVDAQTQADYLVNAYTYAHENWSPWIGPMTPVYAANSIWTAKANEQGGWSIILPDGTTRPAYDALRKLEK